MVVAIYIQNKGLGIKKGPPSKTLIKSEDFNIWQKYFVEVISS